MATTYIPSRQSPFDDAVLDLRAEDLGPYSQSWPNRGTGGSALNAIVGSLRGAEILPDSGGLYLPGVSGNTASIPDESALDVTGDIEIVVRCSLADWTPTGNMSLVTKSTINTSAVTAFKLEVTATTGVLDYRCGDGTSAVIAASTAAPGFTDGTANWLKVTHNLTTDIVRFYKSTDDTNTEPVSWTQIGTDVSVTDLASRYNSSGSVWIGSYYNTFNFAAGTFYRAIVRDGIDGTEVLDIDFTAASVGVKTFTCTTGQTVTVNTATDAAEPKILPHSGYNYYWYQNSLVSTIPDEAALDTTDLDVRCAVVLDDWTPSTAQDFIGRGNVDPNRSFYFRLNTNGTLRLVWYPTGSAASAVTVDSTATVTAPDGTGLLVRVTLDVDNGASGRDVKFYTKSFDASTVGTDLASNSGWTQLGSTKTSTVTSLPAITSTLMYPANVGNPMVGSHYGYWFSGAIDGSVVAQFDAPNDITSGASTSLAITTGQTLTIGRNSSGRKCVLVTRPTILLGTDDYIEIPDDANLDFTTTDSFTVSLAHRPWGTQGTNDALVAKKANTTNTTLGWSLTNGAATALQAAVQLGDGTNGATATAGSRTNGDRSLVSGIRSVSADTITASNDSTFGTPVTDATTATSANTEVVRVGRLAGAGTEYADMEFDHVMVWRRALSSAELAVVAQELETV